MTSSGTTTAPVMTITTYSTTSETSTGNGIATPTPTQPGMVSNCNKFYKVTDEDDVPKQEFDSMAANIERIYKLGEKSGSLVVENSDRKTEWVFSN